MSPWTRIEEWSRAQQRVIELVTGLPPERAELRVPACPDWTVRDLLSHMVGLGVDVVAGDEPDDHNEAWTGKHVTERRGRDVAALVAEWQEVAEPLRAWMRANTVRPLGDVIIHEQDLRGALGVPGGQDTEGLHAIRERFAGRLGPRVADLPPSRWSASTGRGRRPAPSTTRPPCSARPTSTSPGPWSPAARPRSCGPGRCAATSPRTSTPSRCSGRCPRPTSRSSSQATAHAVRPALRT